MTSTFGNLVIASDVEYMVRDVLQKWFPSYLREVERVVEWDAEPLATPRNYTNRNEFEAQIGEELPKVVVISPGLWELPTTPESNGYYRAEWQIAVGVTTAAPTEEKADRMVKMYAAAVRGMMVQNQDLNGLADGVRWLDENYADLPIDDQHANYKAAGVFFAVGVRDTVSWQIRPPMVSEDPSVLTDVQMVITDINDHEVVTP